MGLFGRLKKKKLTIEEKIKQQIEEEKLLMRKEKALAEDRKESEISKKNVAIEKEVKTVDTKGVKISQEADAQSIAESINEHSKNRSDEDESDKENKIVSVPANEFESEWDKKRNEFNRYEAGLNKSRASFSGKINNLFKGARKIDEEFFEELENILIMNDVSVNMVMQIVEEIKREVREQMIEDHALIKEIIADKMFVIYSNWSHIKTTLNVEDDRLNVILMVGVNGAGKTTTIAKLAHNLLAEGKKVMFAAGDTFRAGAVAQLGEWARRLGVECVEGPDGCDPASVIFDGLKRAKEEQVDVLICDTAGRLQNKVNLMNELAKINKIIGREVDGAPHETLLVVDATTGQNGVSQAKHFSDITNTTGIVLTKMDGTSKGGIILSVKDILNIPVKFMGLGEGINDLEEFDLDAYIYGLTKDLMEE